MFESIAATVGKVVIILGIIGLIIGSLYLFGFNVGFGKPAPVVINTTSKEGYYNCYC